VRLWSGVRDPRVFRASTCEQYLAKVKVDSWGFAAAKAARRIVGLAKVTDIESLDESVRVGAARGVLRAARAMATTRHLSADVSRMTEQIGNILLETTTVRASGVPFPPQTALSPAGRSTPAGEHGDA
jgi:5-methylthioribose kinase